MAKQNTVADTTIKTEQPVIAPAPETAPVPAPEQPAPKTIEQLQVEAQELSKNAAEIMANPEVPFEQKQIAMGKSWAAFQAVTKAQNEVKKAELAKAAEDEANKRMAIVDELLASIGAVTPAEGTPAKAIYDDLRNRLKNGVVKNVLHIPMGTTGKQLEKTSGKLTKVDAALEILAQNFPGKKVTADDLKGVLNTHPEYLDEKGGANGTLRTAQWKHNSALK